MKRTVISLSALFTVVAAAAQEDISKHLEVTKAYTPKVGQAAKLPVEPRMVDTVQLRPEIEYSITPTAWQTTFGSDPINAASISVLPFERNRPLYLRAGVGYPLQSTVDLYLNPYMGRNSTMGLFFNHRGSYSKIENSMGIKPKSAEMLNGGGLYGSRFFRRYRLSGGVQYDHRLYNAYGIMPSDIFGFPTAAQNEFEGGEALKYGNLRGNVTFGDTFADLSRFNFAIGVDGGVSHLNSNFYQADVNLQVKMAKMWGKKHGFELGVGERGVIGTSNVGWDAYAFVGMVHPHYLLLLEKFTLRAGVNFDYVYDDWGVDQDYLQVVPHVEAALDLASGHFTPYLTLTSEMHDGSYQALSRKNPYNAAEGPTGWTYDARLGFSGNAADIFTYRLYGGISKLKDYSLFCGIQQIWNNGAGGKNLIYPLAFFPLADDGMMYTAGAEMGLTNIGGFSGRLGANWYKVDFDYIPVSYLPQWDANLELAYSYKDKFTVSAGTTVTGKRDFLTLGRYFHNPGQGVEIDNEFTVNRISTVADIYAGVDVKLFEGFNIFVEGRNLANRKLYPYNYYSGLGINFMAGIKMVF